MAEGFFNHYNRRKEFLGASAGTRPAVEVKQFAVEVMKEKGIDISSHRPGPLTETMIKSAWLIFTMGCLSECPVTPPEKTVDWNFDDPAGKPIEEFRRVRDEIEHKIVELVQFLESANIEATSSELKESYLKFSKQQSSNGHFILHIGS